MLPAQGFTLDRYAQVIQNPEPMWAKFVRKLPTAESAIPLLVGSPLLSRELRNNKVKEERQEEVIKRALVLLRESLGDALITQFFKLQQLETIAAAIPLACVSEPPGADSAFARADLQMTVLFAVIERLCWECGGKDRHQFLFSLLNQIPMPYYKHQLILQQLIPSFDAVHPTHH